MNLRTLFAFLFSISISTSVQAASNALLISDIDDTIRQTNVLNMASLHVLKNDEFAGLSLLYNYLAESTIDKTVYVTGIPDPLKKTSELFLLMHAFPFGKVHARDFFESSTIDHKLKAIRKILKRETPNALVLVGDNGEHDPLIYQTIEAEFPGQSIVYMHQLYDRAIPAGQVPWLTSVDLSLNMYAVGLINSAEFDVVSRNVMSMLLSNDRGVVSDALPAFAQCRVFARNYKRPPVGLDAAQASLMEAYEAVLKARCK